jgi:EAL domain-containing protein (putative c-di-GMP-specific phosphodiesterase class I)/ActR/RegA family two-component response regulator
MTVPFSPLLDASRLDRFRSAIRSAISKPQDGSASAESGKILIVDDDPQVLSLLEKVIRRMGFESRSVSSIDAVDSTAAAGAALMLLDLHVGGDHAMSLIEQLSHAGIAVPVVLMSGYGNRMLNMVRDACADQNCPVAGILSKPFEMSALESLLQQFRRRRSASRMSELKDAIESGDVQPFYQPMVDMRTGRVSGAEALVRWLHAEQGIMLPSDILPEAELQGLMPALTYRMLDQALRDWSRLDNGQGHFGISVNVTADVVTCSDFVPKVIDLLAEHGVPARCLTLEITEQLAALDVSSICTAMCRLRSAGINLALDDFGLGYSSLGALRDLPFNKIKLDRSFVTHAETRPEERMIMASVTRLARDFGLESVAEGIETQGCFDLVRDFGMDCGQGYLMAEPVPCAEFRSRALLRQSAA